LSSIALTGWRSFSATLHLAAIRHGATPAAQERHSTSFDHLLRSCESWAPRGDETARSANPASIDNEKQLRGGYGAESGPS
jgi:hypothetical protein